MLIFLFPVLLLLLSCAEEFERDNPTDPHNIHITYGSLADSRDGKTYKTVVIGEQTWMAENLNYETVSGSYCYSDSNCDKYGRLYDWETAMYACPAGWHLPSKDEWDVLTNFAGDANNLKARDGWADYYINGVLQHGNGIDYYGFAALPNGGSKAYWWSSSEYGNAINATGAYEYIISEGVKYISNNGADKISNLSVRCIKNYQLCGSGTFDPGRQLCSDNVVHDLCNGIEYDPVNHRCGNDNIVETKCGGSWYNES